MQTSSVLKAGAVVAAVLLLTGCAAEAPPASTVDAGPNAADTPASFSELVEVGDGRSLAVTCWGEGDVKIVYLHGMIQPYDDASWAHAPELQERLAGDATYCEYERTNVGKSSSAAGPIPFDETIADLDGVMDAVGATEPVDLVGGSFGGLVASTYAGLHPDRVAGMVLLDPSLAGSNPLEEQFLPPEYRLAPEAWNDSAEKVDVYGADVIATSALETMPEIPGTVFVTSTIDLPPVNTEAFLAAIRAQQQDLADRFSPGELITVDAPHAMVPVVPDQIADAVREVIAEAGLAAN